MSQIIGVSGQFGAGKDVVAAAVADRLAPGSWRHLSFAYALRDEASRLYVLCDNDHARPAFGYDTGDGVLRPTDVQTPRPRLADGSAAPLVPAAPLPCQQCGSAVALPLDGFSRSVEIRKTLQWHGTDVRRAEDGEYWVKRGLEAAHTAVADGMLAVFTDVRFPNEADAIRSSGGVVVRLEVSPEVRYERLMARDGHLPAPGASEHPSEIALNDYPDFDLVVSNDGTLEDTVSAVLEFLRSNRAA